MVYGLGYDLGTKVPGHSIPSKIIEKAPGTEGVQGLLRADRD